MYSKETTLKLLQISNEIFDIVIHKDKMDNGDYQGAIEAQVMIAYQLGLKQNQKYTEALEYGHSEEDLDALKKQIEEE